MRKSSRVVAAASLLMVGSALVVGSALAQGSGAASLDSSAGSLTSSLKSSAPPSTANVVKLNAPAPDLGLKGPLPTGNLSSSLGSLKPAAGSAKIGGGLGGAGGDGKLFAAPHGASGGLAGALKSGALANVKAAALGSGDTASAPTPLFGVNSLTEKAELPKLNGNVATKLNQK